MTPINRLAVQLAINFIKQWAGAAIGEDNVDLIEKEMRERSQNTEIEKLWKWLEEPQTQQQIDKVVSQALDCFMQSKDVDQRLRAAMRDYSPKGVTALYQAIEDLPNQKDDQQILTALADYLARDLPSVPVQSRTYAAQKYLECLRSSIFTLKDTAPKALELALSRIEAQGVSTYKLVEQFYTEWQQKASLDLRRRMIPFKSLIDRKTRGFVGRAALLQAVQAFLNQYEAGYFLIRGVPGIGISAFLARLVELYNYPHHFCVFSEGTGQPSHFFLNACAQLIAFHHLSQQYIPADAGNDSTFFKQTLEAASLAARDGSANGKVVLLVDALDESEGTLQGQNPLYLPQDLPKNVYIICTTRPMGSANRLNTEMPQEVRDIIADSKENREDVHEYITQFLQRPTMREKVASANVSVPKLVELLESRSEWNFMYLYYVLHDLEANGVDQERLKNLPEGLKGYYWQHWQRMQNVEDHISWMDRLSVIAELTVAAEPVSPRLIAQHTSLRYPAVVQIIHEWMQFLQEVPGPEGTRYRIYHNDYRNFLAGIVL